MARTSHLKTKKSAISAKITKKTARKGIRRLSESEKSLAKIKKNAKKPRSSHSSKVKPRSATATREEISSESTSASESTASVQQAPARKKMSVRTPIISQPSTVNFQKRKKKSTVVKEIKFYQKTLMNLIPRACFVRLARKHTDKRFTRESLEMLQEVIEGYIIELFEKGIKVGRHAKRVTCFIRDILLILELENTNPDFLE